MAYVYYNPNPSGKRVGDCVIRGISKVTNQSWEDSYMDVCLTGYRMNDMPSSNAVWSAYLLSNGFVQHALLDACPDCYSVIDFCTEHPAGTYLLGTGTHVVAVVDGDYYDAWDSGFETPVNYWQRRDGDDV